MKPKSTRRATFPRIATTMLVASALSTTAAHAATFQYRHPITGLVSSPTAQAQQVVTEILVALTACIRRRSSYLGRLCAHVRGYHFRWRQVLGV